MQVKEYITKNLPNLNWNILPQIFEDEGVELTEEIKAYLKETPGNTNWNIFNSIINNSAEEIIVFNGEINFNDSSPFGKVGALDSSIEIPLELNSIIVEIDGDQRTLEKSEEFDAISSIGYGSLASGEFKLFKLNSDNYWRISAGNSSSSYIGIHSVMIKY